MTHRAICVPLAQGFEEIEAVTLIDVLRRAGFQVTTCTLAEMLVEGAHGISIRADVEIERALEREWDMVVLPGGMPGATHLRDDERVGRLLARTAERGCYVGAICAAPIALGRFGLLAGKRATCYPGFDDQLTGASYQEDRVVRDGKVMTSRGPGTALEFALAIVNELAGEQPAHQLEQGMLA